MSIRTVLGRWLRRAADRIDPHGAPRMTSLAFTFESGEGLVVHPHGHGCPLWYYGDDAYELAYEHSRTMQR